jgi:hypothetical protein
MQLILYRATDFVNTQYESDQYRATDFVVKGHRKLKVVFDHICFSFVFHRGSRRGDTFGGLQLHWCLHTGIKLLTVFY